MTGARKLRYFGFLRRARSARSNLHRGDRRDHGHDDRDDVERHAAGRHPEQREDEHTEATGEADADTAEARAEEDRREDDQELQCHHHRASTCLVTSSGV